MTQPWKSGLFGCFEDIPACLLGCCCTCYVFGENAEKIDGSDKIKSCIMYALLTNCALCCLVHKPKRVTLRNAYGLEEKPSDFIATCLCSGCGVCQEARELKERGVQSGGRIPVASQPR